MGKGEPNLDSVAFLAAKKDLQSYIRTIGGNWPDVLCEALTRRMIRSYLKTLPSVSKKGHMKPETIALSKLAVGEKLSTTFRVGASAWANRFITVRKITENPLASFRVFDDGETQTIERLPDGTAPQTRPGNGNPRAVFLSQIPLGGSAFLPPWWNPLPSNGRQQVDSNSKQMARRILENRLADWSCHTTSTGTRVTRTK